MEDKFKESIEEAKKYTSKIKDSAHDKIHIKSVVNFAIEIAEHFPQVDKRIVEVAAWWHDVGRLYNDAHEEISAKMAFESLFKKGISEDICKKVYDAIVLHKYSMIPKSIEGEIIRDSDKLDFISLEKWKRCIRNKNFFALNDIARLLPRLRNEFLHLDISKKIYDRLIKDFLKFINSVNDPDFKKIKETILSYGL